MWPCFNVIISQQLIAITIIKVFSSEKEIPAPLERELRLLVLLFMTIFSKSFFTLVCRDFMAFSFFTARHTKNFF